MKTDVRGLVVSEKRVGENDRLVTLLTAEKGILRAFVQRPRHAGGGRLSATRLLTYSRFSIFEGRSSYIVDDAQPIEVFFDLCKGLGSLSLAQYFCELAIALAPQGSEAENFLRLLLNAMYFLCRGTHPKRVLKSIVEMRIMSLAGYMPDLVCCEKCGCYEADKMFFMPRSGKIICGKCFAPPEPPEPYFAMGRGAITAMRHTVYADFDKLFSFRVSEKVGKELSAASERYVLETLGHSFATLDFYHKVMQQPAPEHGTSFDDDENKKSREQET
jgi:DNA repair protein RecO (recombination protein O)